MTKQEVSADFPEPDGVAIVDKKLKMEIWRYGNLELHFTNDKLESIYTDWIEDIDGRDKLIVYKWIFTPENDLSLIGSSRGILLRKGLVTLQFASSISLMAGTFVVYQQLDYMMSRPLGVDISQVIVIERPGVAADERNDRTAFKAAIDVFRHELQMNPAIEAVTASATIPGKQPERKGIVKRAGTSDSVIVRFNSMDYDFLNVFKMRLLAGRAFSTAYPMDTESSVLITQTAARQLGYTKAQDAINQTVTLPEFNWSPRIIGVVNDYHQVSFKKALDPMLFFCGPYSGYITPCA